MAKWYTINDKEKWLFTAPPKTATSSIRRALLGAKKMIETGDVANLLRQHIKAPNHQPMSRFIEVHPDMETWFKFGCVRNPYDRLVSLYHERGKKQNFKKWVMDIKNTSDHETHTQPNLRYQSDWFTEDTHIIRFEHLVEDWKFLREKFDFPKLGHVRKTKGRKAFETYYDTESASYIYEQFKKDFDKYNYKKL
jgi:hypothetical protein